MKLDSSSRIRCSISGRGKLKLVVLFILLLLFAHITFFQTICLCCVHKSFKIKSV